MTNDKIIDELAKALELHEHTGIDGKTITAYVGWDNEGDEIRDYWRSQVRLIVGKLANLEEYSDEMQKPLLTMSNPENAMRRALRSLAQPLSPAEQLKGEG